MEVHRALDNIGRIRFFSFNKDGVSLEENVFEQIVLVLLTIDAVWKLVRLLIGIYVCGGELVHALGNDLASYSSTFVEIRIPELHRGLNLKPSQTREKTIDNAGLVFLTAGVFGCLDHILCDNATVRVGQDALLHLAGDQLLNLIFQTQSNLGNLLRGLGRWKLIGSVRREN